MTNVVEIVNFTLAKGYTKDDFLAANQPMDEFLREQKGMLYRSLCEKADGRFIDIVYWQDMAAAQQGQQAFRQSPQCQQMVQCIEKESVQLEHVNVLASFGCDGG
ncbi:hypothetical protein tinsulaeT_16540 [Thalassotalea insulae]|uniref:ABM domain-containing protein n=1 Tax=Thalassotalea insulae TaxID=2056778 RepID=A0ABQ6GRR3_9GAMM|nr:hypothetical protein [Thalassotalea insulae]GLX78314.1 hypothetical protein tinsulaeT_16540 [Thalassotalea insulae]